MNKVRVKPIWYALSALFLFTACNEKEAIQPVRKNIEEAVFASGYLEQKNNYTVSTKVEGIILDLPVQEGDTVKKNDLIARIENEVPSNNLQDAKAIFEDARRNAAPDSPQLQHIQAQIDQAKEQLSFEKDNYQRFWELYAVKSVSQLDLEQAELQYKTAQSNLTALQKSYQELLNALLLNVERSQVQLATQQALLNDYQLRAEEAGMVISVFKKRGELTRRGEALATIGSGAYLIKLFVAEEDIAKVDIGQSVLVHLNTYPNRSFEAQVSKIYPGFDEAEQSYVLEARFLELPEKLFSGTQLQANIKTGNRKDVLVIPTAYVSKGNRVILENGQEVQILTGSKNNKWTEILAGINESDRLTKPTQ